MVVLPINIQFKVISINNVNNIDSDSCNINIEFCNDIKLDDITEYREVQDTGNSNISPVKYPSNNQEFGAWKTLEINQAQSKSFKYLKLDNVIYTGTLVNIDLGGDLRSGFTHNIVNSNGSPCGYGPDYQKIARIDSNIYEVSPT